MLGIFRIDRDQSMEDELKSVAEKRG